MPDSFLWRRWILRFNPQAFFSTILWAIRLASSITPHSNFMMPKPRKSWQRQTPPCDVDGFCLLQSSSFLLHNSPSDSTCIINHATHPTLRCLSLANPGNARFLPLTLMDFACFNPHAVFSTPWTTRPGRQFHHHIQLTTTGSYTSEIFECRFLPLSLMGFVCFYFQSISAAFSSILSCIQSSWKIGSFNRLYPLIRTAQLCLR